MYNSPDMFTPLSACNMPELSLAKVKIKRATEQVVEETSASHDLPTTAPKNSTSETTTSIGNAFLRFLSLAYTSRA